MPIPAEPPYENRELPDPDNQPLEVVRSIRDRIETRIRTLLTELDAPAP
ncbi:hypothetical protein [Nocardia amamiensis]